MFYDTETANRVRECLAGERGVSERPMFGGLSFLVDGRMAVAVSRTGDLLLRCDPGRTEELVGREHVGRWVMRDRELRGWLRVQPPAYTTDDGLAAWVARGVAAARAAR